MIFPIVSFNQPSFLGAQGSKICAELQTSATGRVNADAWQVLQSCLQLASINSIHHQSQCDSGFSGTGAAGWLQQEFKFCRSGMCAYMRHDGEMEGTSRTWSEVFQISIRNTLHCLTAPPPPREQQGLVCVNHSRDPKYKSACVTFIR